ncbi:hypothetical protein DFH29DRAFT_1040226 [Suillus ampliporus]|nr:hypothetical protein DFH29DRAFT_1040226 [Suillus ampliporus]
MILMRPYNFFVMLLLWPPEGCDGHDTYLNNLATSLNNRFDHQGKSHDLDEAISWHEEVLRQRPIGHQFRCFSLNDLGDTLRNFFEKYGDTNDVNRAISLFREALTLCPPGHPIRDIVLNNLALTFTTRHDKLPASKDLNEAIDSFRESLRLKQHDNPECHKTLLNLSAALCSRFRETRKNEDVEEAIDLCQQSLHQPADLSLTMENYRLASKHPTQGFPAHIADAYYWTVSAEECNHISALEAYATFFELLDNHLAMQSSTTSWWEAATTFSYARTLPGHGQQWSLASRLRTPLEDLGSTEPQPSSQVLGDQQALVCCSGFCRAAQTELLQTRAAVEYRRLTKEWEAVVAETHNIQGFSQFLLPLSYDELQAAACHGPVIILIARQPHHVPFPSVSLAGLEVLNSDFAKAIRQVSGMQPKEPRTAADGTVTEDMGRSHATHRQSPPV